MTDDLRARADHLERGAAKDGFRRRATLDDAGQRETVTHAVARAREGDREAVRYLYLRYSDNVYGYVRSIVRDDHEAEDVTQHVFAKLMTVLGRYEQRGVPFSAWILRLAHNASVDHLRSRRPIPCEEIRGAGEAAEDSAPDRTRCLRTALAALPDDQRNVVMLRHLVGLTPGEIAERMGKSESAIHGLHHRGRRALQVELTRLAAGPSTATVAAIA